MPARTFLCREALWETFEEIAREQRAPIDEVLSEAMRSYAEQRSYGAPSDREPAEGASRAHDYQAEDADLARTGAYQPGSRRAPAPAAEAPPTRRPPAMAHPSSSSRGAPTTRGVAPPHSVSQARGAASRPEPPARSAVQRPFTQPLGHAMPAPPPRGGAARAPSGGAPLPPPTRGMPPPPRSVPPPLPASQPYMEAANPYAPPRARVANALSLTYKNRTVEVKHDRFLLGRSRSQANLVLDDPNVSRQHAAIERVGDTWVLADLGSTNGCYIDGQRVTRRQIVDGDVIEITSHQVRCTLR